MSNIFRRINDVMNANINDLIDKVEDPERMIKQIIREMEDNIRQSKEGVIVAIASEKRLYRELEQNRTQRDNWQHKAETAMLHNNEELARSALVQKKEYEKVIKQIEPIWDSAVHSSDTLKDQLKQLENKLQDAKRKKGSLIARQKAAQTQSYMQNVDTNFNAQLLAQDNFDRMEDKVLEMEARAQARSELDGLTHREEEAYIEMEITSEIDSEMDALKRQFKK
ncbi:MAG: PspA/IM30 family protein [Gammaproteobacteria bacterium]|nr:PspA/IM30 family protein [Gammaproteobacteria bacterium]